jgi:hypothetical protein
VDTTVVYHPTLITTFALIQLHFLFISDEEMRKLLFIREKERDPSLEKLPLKSSIGEIY